MTGRFEAREGRQPPLPQQQGPWGLTLLYSGKSIVYITSLPVSCSTRCDVWNRCVARPRVCVCVCHSSASGGLWIAGRARDLESYQNLSECSIEGPAVSVTSRFQGERPRVCFFSRTGSSDVAHMCATPFQRTQHAGGRRVAQYTQRRSHAHLPVPVPAQPPPPSPRRPLLVPVSTPHCHRRCLLQTHAIT
jgi:hypothetical protein